ncbi:AraC family transcriptional regulator [Paenibacillus sp. NEAU-GSW1]|uniref:helix-turn-helix transcriptional regulator n=1 Tax=Paenibacillus sp. NEAU-GSW1 TaxID=2682486 RepID=UPI001565413B|nr:AraC family transcriptional regulator [Paenibacillus sp. NEAU-GSW1]
MKLINERIVQHQFIQYQAEVIMAARSVLASPWSESRTDHDFYRLVYIAAGKALFTIDGQPVLLEPGKLYLLTPGSEQTIAVVGDEMLVAYWSHFRLMSQERPPAYKIQLPLYVEVLKERPVIGLFQKMIEAQSTPGLTKGLRMQAALLELLAHFFDESASSKTLIPDSPEMDKWHDVLLYIDLNLHRNIQIEELAKVAYLHPNYFITAFKVLMGCAPIQYVTEQRLEAAKKWLAETTLPIAEVAASVGMLSHYLSRLFKRKTGITPMQYRRLMQERASALKQVTDAEKECE